MKKNMEIKIFQKPEKCRKDSFWFDGEVASLSLGETSVSIMATGHVDVCFNENESNVSNDHARKEARRRGYTDRKLKNLSKHDGWSNNNWFGFLITLPSGKEKWDEATDINFDDAIYTAKQILLDKE